MHLLVQLLLGPILRNAPGARNVKLEPRLDLTLQPFREATLWIPCPLPPGVSKDFSVGYVGATNQTSWPMVERRGWKLVHRESYAEEFQPAMLMSSARCVGPQNTRGHNGSLVH